MARDHEWEVLCREYQILERIEQDGYFRITADQIHAYYEPRAIVKFDASSQLPEIFRQHHLAILPDTRGSYVIAPMAVYHTLEAIDEYEIEDIPWQHAFSSIPDIHQVASEAVLLNMAEISGMLRAFTGEEHLYETLNGRMGTLAFDFRINLGNDGGETFTFHVDRSQMEIDGSYEGDTSYTIIEAKAHFQPNFIVRQLYYPYRNAYELGMGHPGEKTIRPVFMSYYNQVFHFWEYTFEDPENYSSIRLVRNKNYSLDDTRIYLGDVERALRQTHVEPEPDLPFVQADSMERVINLVEYLADNEEDQHALTGRQIGDMYEIVQRQGEYYGNAGCYLGLLHRNRDSQQHPAFVYTLSEDGHQFWGYPYRLRMLELLHRLFQHRVFHDAVDRMLVQRHDGIITIPPVNEVTARMRDAGIDLASERRRAQTVQSWLYYIFSRCQDIHVMGYHPSARRYHPR